MPDADCIFCRIARGDIPAEIVLQDDDLVAFKDIHPAAPVHLLVVPRKHLPTLDDATPEDGALLGRMLLAAARLAREHGISEGGYRTIINCRAEAGQEVFHLHLHVLGGRRMRLMG